MKPSILFVGNFLSEHGYTRQFIEDLTDHLQSAGWGIIRASKILVRPLRLMDMAFTILDNQRNYALGHIAVFSGLAFIWAETSCWMFKVMRKPLVLSLHGGNLPVFARRWPGRVKRLLQGAHTVVAPSRYLQEAMRPYRDDILMIPNPLEIKNYPFHLRSNPAPSLVWLRAFHNIYHPQMAPQVIANLHSIFPDLHLTMIGPDKGDGALQETQALIKTLGLQENIEIVPGISKSEVPEYLGRADIFINTTNIDNTPVSVLEAMACGLCVVSTNVGGIPYLLEDGKDALLVPPDDPEAMASAVRRILTEPGLAGKLSANARKKVEQFDWSVILPQWEALFNELISHG
jgi:glycosyltransferase involved in cell wall biosynthesis